MQGKHQAGKGDLYRRVDQKKWAENWEAIFGGKSRKKSQKRAKPQKDSK